MTRHEHTIPFRGFETKAWVVGDADEPGKLPLLCLHGGPGAPHDYLEPLAAMAETGRRVVFYDQLGCGQSSRTDESLWTVETFVDEVGVVRDALGLDRVHLFGSSWGGMLAMEYALTQPAGLESLVLSSSPSDLDLWVAETARLRSELPEDVRRVLDEHEAAGTIDDPAYEAAAAVFYRRHVCRADPWPDWVTRTFRQMEENPDVYVFMQGPNEFTVSGTLSGWTITERLGEIRVPTLVTSGRYDECTPLIAKTVVDAIPGAEWAVFEESSHMQFTEEPELYLQTLGAFLAKVEAAR